MSAPRFAHWLQLELTKFLIVGGCATVVNYLVFLSLHSGLDWHYVVSSGFGYLVGLTFGYVLNRRWTFTQRASQLAQPWEFLLYSTIYLSSLGLSLIILHWLVDTLGLQPWLANGLVIGQTTITNFLGLRLIVFRKKLVITKP